MSGLLFIELVLVLRLKQHMSHAFLDKHFTNDEIRSPEQLCTL